MASSKRFDKSSQGRPMNREQPFRVEGFLFFVVPHLLIMTTLSAHSQAWSGVLCPIRARDGHTPEAITGGIL